MEKGTSVVTHDPDVSDISTYSKERFFQIFLYRSETFEKIITVIKRRTRRGFLCKAASSQSTG